MQKSHSKSKNRLSVTQKTHFKMTIVSTLMIHCLPRKTMLYPHKSFSILFPAEFWRSNVARCGFSNTCVLPAQLLSTHVFYSLVLHVESSNVQATHEKDLKLSAGHSKCSLKNVWTYLHNIRTFLVCMSLRMLPTFKLRGWLWVISKQSFKRFMISHDICDHGWSSS